MLLDLATAVYAEPPASPAFWTPARPVEPRKPRPYVRPPVVPLTGSGRLQVTVKATGAGRPLQVKAAGSVTVRATGAPVTEQHISPDWLLLELLEDW